MKVKDVKWDGDTDAPESAVPKKLVFYCGNLSGSSFFLSWDGDILIAESSREGPFSLQRERVPAPAEWRDLNRAFLLAGVPGWLPLYTCAHGCSGVTYWFLSWDDGKNPVVSRGSDAYPPGTGDCPDPFGTVTTAIRKIGQQSIREPSQKDPSCRGTPQ